MTISITQRECAKYALVTSATLRATRNRRLTSRGMLNPTRHAHRVATGAPARRRSGADAPRHSRTILTSHTVEFTTHNIMMWDILSSTAEFLGWTELKTLFTKIISDTNHPVRVCQNLSFPQDGHPLR